MAWIHAMSGAAVRTGNFRHGVGCQYCNSTGYRGRVGLYELLELDGTLAEFLRAGDYTSFEQAASRQTSFRPLALSGLDAALQGATTIGEVIRVAGTLEDMPGYVRKSAGQHAAAA